MRRSFLALALAAHLEGHAARAARIVGRETVDYVGNIHKYYVAYKLAKERHEQRRQARQQAPAARTE